MPLQPCWVNLMNDLMSVFNYKDWLHTTLADSSEIVEWGQIYF